LRPVELSDFQVMTKSIISDDNTNLFLGGNIKDSNPNDADAQVPFILWFNKGDTTTEFFKGTSTLDVLGTGIYICMDRLQFDYKLKTAIGLGYPCSNSNPQPKSDVANVLYFYKANPALWGCTSKKIEAIAVHINDGHYHYPLRIGYGALNDAVNDI